MRVNNRGQVTIFVIIAIVIVVVIVLLLFLINRNANTNIQSDNSKLSLVPAQVRPVYIYIDNDLKKIAENGLEILRLQGGYIYLPDDAEIIEIETAGKHVKNEDGTIELIEGSGKTKNPIWVNKDSIAVPSIDFMQDQLSQYIENELSKEDFSQFEAQGMVISTEPINAEVSLSDAVNINVIRPVNINYKDQSYTFEEFSQRASINFTQIYDVASTLVVYELASNYLEAHAKSLMSLYSYAGGEKEAADLPPHSFTETNTNCKFVAWSKSDVESNLKTIFSVYYPFLKMDKTNFERVKASDPVSQGVYDSFIYNYFPEMKNIHINFSYDPQQTFEFTTTPSNLVPDRISQTKIPFLPSFCVFKYKFAYTISAPIIIKIKDDNSGGFSKEGYEFYFPIKLYICNDKERACGDELLLNVDLTEISGLTGDKFYNCQDVDNQKIISVSDSLGNPLEGADVTHYCDGYANNCWLGITNSQGKATINLPNCDNSSSIEVVKENYQTVKEEIRDSYILENLKEFEVDAKIIDAKKFAAAYSLTNGFKDSSCGKSAQTLLSESISTPNTKDSIMISLSGPSSVFVSYPTPEKIKLAGGNYKMNSIVNGYVKIQPYSYLGEMISFNTTDNTKPYEGEWLLGSSEDNLIITSSDLSGKDKVTFYALVEHLSTEELSVEDFMETLITPEGLVGKVSADTDCNGVVENIDVNISKSEYNNFIKPKFV
ncbi:MAG: hypothetical protein PHH54_02955 [Candidatus Nanoarchaeia archaeon]|nr:hypothetical protein [Candidatus Nanoarchaeia archaeon]MDD5740919.1 hypothetical protein [Candidatus Nanoarchaeia archaeon]